MKYVYIFWLNALVFGFESVLDRDTVVEGEPFTIRCGHLYVNTTVTCRSSNDLEIYMNRKLILRNHLIGRSAQVYYPKDGNWEYMCNEFGQSVYAQCMIFVRHAGMDHQGLYDCYFTAREYIDRDYYLCKHYGSSTLKVVKASDVTTSLKTTETRSSSDVSESRHSEKRFSTTVSPPVTNTTGLPATEESLDLSIKVLIATATFVAMLGEVSFFTIAWIFLRKARSMAAMRNLFQNQDQTGPKTAISQNPTDDKTSLGSDITDRCTQTTPDAVLDQHTDLHQQPISRTELVYLAAQQTPGQELIDRSDIMSGISGVKSEHQGIGRRSKLI